MKKKIIAYMLAFAGITVNLCAQTLWTAKSKTDMLFDVSNPSLLKHRFIITLENGNIVMVQISLKEQFDMFLNTDSLVKAVAADLLPLKDSFANELTNKKVDRVISYDNRTRIRYKEHEPKGTSFVTLKDGLTPMKIEQDTLIIVGYTKRPETLKWPRDLWMPYKITILINNITQLEKIADGTLNKLMQEIKTDWDNSKNWKDKGTISRGVYASYNLTYPAANVKLRTTFYPKRLTVAPYVQIGIQNIGNILATSAGVGIMVQQRASASSKIAAYLFWEPYFFFDRKIDGHLKMRRSDFITLQYVSSYTYTSTKKVEFNQSFSLSYLTHRSGTYFYDNTFKVGLPGAKYDAVSLRPEFIFNDLFKNFQPGLKLVLDLD